MKSEDVPALTDFTSTTSEFVKKFQLFQLLVMLVSSLTAPKGALHVHLDAELAQVPQFALLVFKTDLALSMEPAEPSVVMELLLELNNVTIKTLPATMDAHLLAQLSLCGLVLDSHQFVLTTALPFVETAELKEMNNVMMETWLMVMAVTTDARENLAQAQQTTQVEAIQQPQSLKD